MKTQLRVCLRCSAQLIWLLMLEIKHDSSWTVIDRWINVMLDDELKKIMTLKDNYMNKTVLWLVKDSELIDK